MANSLLGGSAGARDSQVKGFADLAGDIPIVGPTIQSASNALSIKASVGRGFEGDDTVSRILGFQLPIEYWFKFHDPKMGNTYVPLPFPPSQIIVSRQSPTVITRTLKANNPHRETSSQFNHQIIIRGSSGFAGSLGSDRFGELVYATGEERFLEFDEFLKGYQETLDTYFNNGNSSVYKFKTYAQWYKQSQEQNIYRMQPNLQFLSTKEQLKFYVEPLSFVYQKNAASNRFSYQYELILQAYAYSDDFKYSKSYADIIAEGISSASRSLLYTLALAELLANSVTESLNTITGSLVGNTKRIIGQVSSTVSSINNLVNAPFKVMADLKRLGEEINSTLFNEDFYLNSTFAEQDVVAVRQAVGDFVAKGADFVTAPIFETATLALTKETSIQRENESVAAMNYEDVFYFIELYTSAIPREIRKTINPIDYINYLEQEENIRALAENTQTLGNGSSILDRFDTAHYLNTVVRGNEDLRGVAQRTLGSENEWTILANINNFVDYRTKRDGSLIEAGDTIKIPFTGNTFLNIPRNTNIKRNEETLGVDMRMNGSFDLTFSNNDLDVVTGKANVTQFVKNCLFTRKGDITLNPNFGLGFPIGEPIQSVTESAGDLLAIEIVNELKKDPRFSAVTNVNIQFTGDTADIAMDLFLVNNDSINLSVPLI
jgi:hypothetical protein